MRYFYALLLMLPLAFTSRAQQNYATSLIPKELLPHASSVVRDEETTVEVKDLNNILYHHKYVITVLNKNGDNDARLFVWYDKVQQIKSIKGLVFDEFGKITGKIAEHDFDDLSAADGFSLFLDERYKRFKPAVSTYPYTVEYDYEVNSKQTMMFEDWNPTSVDQSVQHSWYKVVCKPDFGIRYKENNYPGKAVIEEANGLKTYTWELNNVKALRYEPYSPISETILTSVRFAPQQFAYGKIQGSFTNWKEFGKFMNDKLLKDRQYIPTETAEHIKEITRDIPDPKQKAKVIYEYMQQKTRYVSVQIGIGGWQPFLASDVDQLSYGDCKALVNYTQSLLKIAGIESYYTIVTAGRDSKISMEPDFASVKGNHIILCLPFKNDTTWIDCTSKENPFGYLGTFTDDRIALACTPEGGKLMHTPKYSTLDNKQIRKGTFSLAGSGELSGEMVTKFEGSQYDNREELVNEARTEQLKMLKEVYPIENLDIQSFDLKQDKGIKPVTTEIIKLQARDYMSQNGGRFFFLPNTASRYVRRIKDVTNRVNPVYINRGYIDVDEISYALPDGYKADTRPLNVNIDKPFGKYHASTQIVDNKLIYKRSLQINDGTYDKDLYHDLVDFYESVYEADNYTLTMEKK